MRKKSSWLLHPLTFALHLAFMGTTTLTLALPMPVQAQQSTFEFTIPAGGLKDVLTVFARQTRVNVSFTQDMVGDGKQSRGVHGHHTVEQALHYLLAGSGLVAVKQDNGFILQQNDAVMLAPVRVSDSAILVSDVLPDAYAGGQTARGARAGLLGNKDVMDIPFSMTSYTESFLRNRGATTVADALAYDPSVAVSQTGGMVDSYSIRGFPIAEGNVGEIAFNGIYGIAPNYRAFTPYVERVEVLKGATGLLYGVSPDGGIGGVINVVPKRAEDTPTTRVAANYGQSSVAGLQVDIGRRFGSDKQWGVRANGSHEQGDTAVDNQHRKISVGSLGLDYRSEKLNASLDLIGQDEDWDSPSRVYSVAAGVKVPGAVDGRNNPAQTWGWSRLDDKSALLDVQYHVNDKLTIFGNAGQGTSKVSRLFDQQMVFSNDQGDFSSIPRYGLFEVERDTASAGARMEFDTGAIRHNATVQASVLEVTNYQNSADGMAMLSNLYRPVRHAVQVVNQPDNLPRVGQSRLNSLALTDTLSLLEERVQIIAGARYQEIDADNWDRVSGARTNRYRSQAWTPAVGVIFKSTSSTMFYGSYIEGLSRGEVAPAAAINAGEMMEPYTSEQYELGFKADLNSLLFTASVFQITKPSAYLSDGIFGVNGKQRNIGAELSLQGEPVSHIRLLGGVTWLDSSLVRTANPETQGNQPVGVPDWHATLGAEWDLAWAPGLTLTSGLIHSARQYVNPQNTAHVSAWTRVDFGARYVTAIQSKDVTFLLNVENAFNHHYWSGVSQWGAFALGSPRTVSLSASVSF